MMTARFLIHLRKWEHKASGLNSEGQVTDDWQGRLPIQFLRMDGDVWRPALNEPADLITLERGEGNIIQVNNNMDSVHILPSQVSMV